MQHKTNKTYYRYIEIKCYTYHEPSRAHLNIHKYVVKAKEYIQRFTRL